MSTSTHNKVLFLSEIVIAFSEKSEARESVTTFTVTSDELFAAKDNMFMTEREL